MSSLVAKLETAAKAVAAAVVGAIAPLLIVGFTNGFDWKAILAAAGTSALSAVTVFLTANAPASSTAHKPFSKA